MNIWLNIELRDFDCSWDSRSGQLDQFELRKPINLVDHAEVLLGSNTQDFNADAIVNLNRAVDIRLKQISLIYGIKSCEALGKYREWDRLEKLGIIRKRFIDELNKYRNLIEHSYKKPPRKEVIENFVDLCWYFIKSTDGLCGASVETVEFVNYETQDRVYCDLKYGRKWSIRANGNAHKTRIERTARPGLFSVESCKLNEGNMLEEQRLQRIAKYKDSGEKVAYIESQPFEKDHIYWTGKLVLSEQQMYSFHKTVFELT